MRPHMRFVNARTSMCGESAFSASSGCGRSSSCAGGGSAHASFSPSSALYYSISLGSRRLGMNTADHEYPNIVTVEVTDRWITATFTDGRQISLPLAWSWQLERAMPAQRARWELIGDGEGVRWP